MRVERGSTTWTMYPTTKHETSIFAAIIERLVPGDKIDCADEQHGGDGRPRRLFLMAGGAFHQTTDTRGGGHVTWCTWIGGIGLPVAVTADAEFRQLINTMKTSGLQYVGPHNGGLEVFGTSCGLCGGRILDCSYCVYRICAHCTAQCEHTVWEDGALVTTADGGIAMGEQCVRCKLKRGPATDDRAGVERTTGIYVLRPGDDLKEAVQAMFMPDPPTEP